MGALLFQAGPQHYHTVKGQNVEDILDAILIINAAYPDKNTLPVVFVAIRTSNLPFVCEKMSPSRDSFVESRLAALELQMVEVLARPIVPRADNARLEMLVTAVA